MRLSGGASRHAINCWERALYILLMTASAWFSQRKVQRIHISDIHKTAITITIFNRF